MKEWIKIGPETRCNQLDISALYGHHEWSDACMREHIVLELLDGHELVKSLRIPRSARKVKRRPPIIVSQVDVGTQADDLRYI